MGGVGANNYSNTGASQSPIMMQNLSNERLLDIAHDRNESQDNRFRASYRLAQRVGDNLGATMRIAGQAYDKVSLNKLVVALDNTTLDTSFNNLASALARKSKMTGKDEIVTFKKGLFSTKTYNAKEAMAKAIELSTGSDRDKRLFKLVTDMKPNETVNINGHKLSRMDVFSAIDLEKRFQDTTIQVVCDALLGNAALNLPTTIQINKKVYDILDMNLKFLAAKGNPGSVECYARLGQAMRIAQRDSVFYRGEQLSSLECFVLAINSNHIEYPQMNGKATASYQAGKFLLQDMIKGRENPTIKNTPGDFFEKAINLSPSLKPGIYKYLAQNLPSNMSITINGETLTKADFQKYVSQHTR